jgi:hypothetical protein
MRGISWPAERLSVSQEGLCSMEVVVIFEGSFNVDYRLYFTWTYSGGSGLGNVFRQQWLFSSLPTFPEKFWDTPSLLSSGYWGHFLWKWRDQRLKITIYLQLVHRLIYGALSPFPLYLLTYLLTYSMVQDIIWKAFTQFVKNIPPSYGTQRFITVFTKARHRTLFWARWIQFAPSIPISLRNIFIPLISFHHMVPSITTDLPLIHRQSIQLEYYNRPCRSWGVIEKLLVAQLIKEPEGSVPYSQEPDTGSYPHPTQFTPHSYILCIWDTF